MSFCFLSRAVTHVIKSLLKFHNGICHAFGFCITGGQAAHKRRYSVAVPLAIMAAFISLPLDKKQRATVLP